MYRPAPGKSAKHIATSHQRIASSSPACHSKVDGKRDGRERECQGQQDGRGRESEMEGKRANEKASGTEDRPPRTLKNTIPLSPSHHRLASCPRSCTLHQGRGVFYFSGFFGGCRHNGRSGSSRAIDRPLTTCGGVQCKWSSSTRLAE